MFYGFSLKQVLIAVSLAAVLAVFGGFYAKYRSVSAENELLNARVAGLSAQLTLQNKALEVLKAEAELVKKQAQNKAKEAQKLLAASQKRASSIKIVEIPQECEASLEFAVELSTDIAKGWK
jgi:type II secretory pathway component PulJ